MRVKNSTLMKRAPYCLHLKTAKSSGVVIGLPVHHAERFSDVKLLLTKDYIEFNICTFRIYQKMPISRNSG
jgi:hypothetical protein